MKKIRIVCVGKASKPYYRDGIDEYIKRLKPFYEVTATEIPEMPTVKKECDEILKRAGEGFFLLDIGGEQFSSEEFSGLLQKAHERADEIVFVIGGASGVDERLRSAAAKRISFGKATYPHQLARLILSEQLYRAACILRGVPYHK